MDNSPPSRRRRPSTFTLSRASSAVSSFASLAAAHPTPPLDDTSTFDWVTPVPAQADSTGALMSSYNGSGASNSLGGSGAAGNGGPAAVGSVPNIPGTSLSTTLDGLRSLVGKRITAWTYLKNAGEGRVYWFNTVLLTAEDLRETFANDKMRNRTTRFAVLGMSLSALLEIGPAHDFLRSLLSLTQEFESVPEDRYGGRNQRSLFKVGSRSRRGGAASGANGGGDFSMGLPQEGGDATFLFTPNIPFELDYFQVLVTMCELLIETYTKIASYLGAGGGGGATSGLFPSPPNATSSGSAQRGSILLQGMGAAATGAAGVGSAGLSQALADVVYKIDGRLKKLVALLSKEIDGLARQAIRTELDSLSRGGGAGVLGLLD